MSGSTATRQTTIRHDPRYFAQLQDESYLGFLGMVIFSLPRPQTVKTPFLVLGADKDAIIGPREVAATARAHGVEAEIFPGMAHDMMLEAGWQAVADCIVAWLAQRGL